jgi:hypothetical protein
MPRVVERACLCIGVSLLTVSFAHWPTVYLFFQPPFGHYEYVVEFTHDHSCHPHRDQLRNFYRLVGVPWPYEDDTCPAYFRPARSHAAHSPSPAPVKGTARPIRPAELDINNAVRAKKAQELGRDAMSATCRAPSPQTVPLTAPLPFPPGFFS